MSRLLTNLMLLKQDYQFTSVVSHEKVVEIQKAEYYTALNKTQKSWKTAKEDITPWLLVVKIQAKEALMLLEHGSIEHLLSPKQLELWQWALQNEPKEFSRKEAVQALGFAERTVEESIKKLVSMKRLERLGQGRAIRYRVTRD